MLSKGRINPHPIHTFVRSVLVMLVVMGAASPARAGPAMSWGEQFIRMNFDECMRRASNAFRLEGWTSVPRVPPAKVTFGTKDIHSAYIACNETATNQWVVNIVVASLSEDPGVPGFQRERLQTRMAESSTGTASPPSPAVQSPSTPPPLATPAPAGGNVALHRPAQQSSTSEWSKANDAQGGVDGIKNGAFGFHTGEERNPWWQVDLGEVMPLAEVRVFNRIDCCPERARTLRVLLSDDGVSWTTAYTHDGSVFGGVDNKPLVVNLGGRTGRYLRLQLTEKTSLHLDEVEIIRQ